VHKLLDHELLWGYPTLKIYTKTGDDGTTGLFAGPRVPKNHPRIAAYGAVDELNAALGVAIASLLGSSDLPQSPETTIDLLTQIQQDLFSVGAELATPDPDKHGMRLLNAERVETLESAVDALDSQLPPLSAFILPGGSASAANLHLARTICRRAERDILTLADAEPGGDFRTATIYLNRLSDLLFVLARYENDRIGSEEVQWHKPAVES